MMRKKRLMMMLSNFRADLEKAKTAEKIALEALQAYSDSWSLEDVSNDRSCFYLGDIKATLSTGAV